MKIKLKYQIIDAEGINKKTYTKTFAMVNESATKEDFQSFAESYLGLVEGNGQNLDYQIIKTNEEEIISASL